MSGPAGGGETHILMFILLPARPCSGCTKKGYAASQCIDGCDPCRRARVRCEDGKPCARCREMQLECVEEASSLMRHEAGPGPRVVSGDSVGRTSRAKGGERAKLACQACRRDNKKVNNAYTRGE